MSPELSEALRTSERSKGAFVSREYVSNGPRCDGIVAGVQTEFISHGTQFRVELRGIGKYKQRAPEASRRLNFSEMPGVSEPMLLGAPALSELGFGLSSDAMELRRLGLEIPYIKKRSQDDRFILQNYVHLVGPGVFLRNVVDNSHGTEGWIVPGDANPCVGMEVISCPLKACKQDPTSSNVTIAIGVAGGCDVLLGPDRSCWNHGLTAPVTDEELAECQIEGMKCVRQRELLEGSGYYDTGQERVISI